MSNLINITNDQVDAAIKADGIALGKLAPKDQGTLRSYYKGKLYRAAYNRTTKAKAAHKAYNTDRNALAKRLIAANKS